ncbi:uncharacterized protein LOC142368244 [Odontesthes bonariensis]|uniref:uncharacterized protein LOC142368244 n=1 Tax=Odontesthes bonariensis TaxID=219752 RepID=UPI003F582D18
MNLWLCCHLLFAALFHSSSALTPEECQPLVTPLSLADPSVMEGKFYFHAGYTDHEVHKAILKITDSSWTKFTASPSSKTEILMSQENKINGTCFGSTSNMTTEGNTVSVTFANTTSTSQVLPSCDTCLVFFINCTIRNTKKLFEAMKISNPTGTDEFEARSVYLYGTEVTLKDSDLEHFKKQASCFGFSGELDYHFDPEKTGVCEEGEGIRIP